MFKMALKILKGVAASSGVARGRVHKVTGIEDTSSFKNGEVLVTHLTDPSMVLMLGKSAAVITDVGGMTSHPAIVSREFGIPCVVGTKTATKDLKDGMLVEVNGSTGEVFLVEA